MNIDDIPVVSLTPYECRVIFYWLQVVVHEVDITTKDIHVLNKIQPHLPEDYKAMIQDMHDKYNGL